EEVISRIPKSDENDVQRAIEAAKASQRDWEKKPSIERAEYLYKLADKIEEKKETFINMLTEENGKTVDASKAEVDLTIDYFRYMA
ncbi:aldehyde dehydrogenase family protein, partial [Planococcus sp. SIMBA_143]